MEVSWQDIKRIISMIKIIDIRDNYLYKMNKIVGSMNIPYQFLLINPGDYLKKDIAYYLVCEEGKKSQMVSNILNKKGYKTYSIKGGMNEYKNNYHEKY